MYEKLKITDGIDRKYELTDETKTIVVDGVAHVLHRIRVIRHIRGRCTVGFVGGWVESERNLDHNGECLIYDEAMVFGRARVRANARIRGQSMVYGTAVVSGDARVYDTARVYGNASVHGGAEIYGDADVAGEAVVYSRSEVGRDAVIREERDVIVVSPVGSEDGTLTFYRTATDCRAIRGCFSGTLDAFADAVKHKHDTSDGRPFFYEYQCLIQLARARFPTPVDAPAVNTIVADEEQAASDETFALKP